MLLRSVLLSTATRSIGAPLHCYTIDLVLLSIAALHCYTIGAVLHCYTPRLRVFRYFYTIVVAGLRVWRAGLDCG
ncbi:unnamed protein product, partial [Ilex paraguariensis]